MIAWISPNRANIIRLSILRADLKKMAFESRLPIVSSSWSHWNGPGRFGACRASDLRRSIHRQWHAFSHCQLNELLFVRRLWLVSRELEANKHFRLCCVALTSVVDANVGMYGVYVIVIRP